MVTQINQSFDKASQQPELSKFSGLINRDAVVDLFKIGNSAFYEKSENTNPNSDHFKQIAACLKNNPDYQTYFQTLGSIKTASTFVYENTKQQTCIFCDFTLRADKNAMKHSIMIIADDKIEAEKKVINPHFIMIGKNISVKEKNDDKFTQKILVENLFFTSPVEGLLYQAKTTEDVIAGTLHAERIFTNMIQEIPQEGQKHFIQPFARTQIPFDDIKTIFQLENTNIYTEYKNEITPELLEILKNKNMAAYTHIEDKENMRHINMRLSSEYGVEIGLIDYEYIENAEIEHYSVLFLYGPITINENIYTQPLFLLSGHHKKTINNGTAETQFEISEMGAWKKDGNEFKFETRLTPTRSEYTKGICYAENMFIAGCADKPYNVPYLSNFWFSPDDQNNISADEYYEDIKNRSLKQLMGTIQKYYNEGQDLLTYSDTSFYINLAHGIH